MDLLDAHGAAMHEFDQVIHQVAEDQWDLPTPCSEWSVRDLVNHLVAEQLWSPHLLAGRTIEDVGGTYDGDVLGDDPLASWERSSQVSRKAWIEPGAAEGLVHVSFGQIDAVEYGWQMTVDLAVHGWDLATAIGLPQPIGDDLARELLALVEPQVDAWQGAGVFDPPVPVPEDTSAADRLVALLGRDPN
jgi:uncharacterized protein (TIGR03086 family)